MLLEIVDWTAKDFFFARVAVSTVLTLADRR